jgi:hypothetical protein
VAGALEAPGVREKAIDDARKAEFLFAPGKNR